MKLTLSRIPPEGLTFAFDAPTAGLVEIALGAGLHLSGRADGDAQGLSAGMSAGVPGGFRIQGLAETELSVECARCLQPFAMGIRARLDATFRTVGRVGTGEEEEMELQAQDMQTYPLPADGVDVVAVFWEQVLLEVPMAPKCSDSCAGLCGRCGANLNRGECGCRPEMDPRFSALEKLL